MVTKHKHMSLYFLQLNQVVVQIIVWPSRLAKLMKSSPLVLVCGRSPTEIVGSNPTGGMDVYLLCALCVVR